MHQNKHQNKAHQPVLLQAVLEYLAPQKGESYLDLTAGYGGHAEAVLEKTQSPAQTVLIDRDESAVKKLQEAFADKPVEIHRQDFLTASRELKAEGRQFDLILADLGVSSPHFNRAERGFSFARSGPLDMRMDQSQALTAEVIVNSYSETQLTNIFRRYGEEPQALKFARAIVNNRPLKTTGELAELIANNSRLRSKIHPATRVFQALRIAVNDELDQLEQALPVWLALLKPGGRIAVISFHSLEDRLVKQALAGVSGDGFDANFHLLTKRPISPTPNEIVLNPRSRSAKLRVAAKIKTEGNFYAYSGKK